MTQPKPISDPGRDEVARPRTVRAAVTQTRNVYSHMPARWADLPQLSDRLATEGGTVEEWNKLDRSLAVLERKDEAQKIYDEARAKFAGQAAELSFLKQAAVESGLTP